MSLSPLRHARRLCVLACLLFAASSGADSYTVTWEPELIPDPSLEGMEPKVREQLRTALDEVRRLRRSSWTPEQLGNAYGELGRLYLAYDLTEPAAACLRNAARLASGDLRWTYLLGTVAQTERRLEEAEKAFHAALALDPTHLPSMLRLGDVYLTAGEPGTAASFFHKVLKATSSGPRQEVAAAHAGLARAATARGEPEAAVTHYLAALELQPAASALRYPLALAYRELGDLEAARQQLAQRGTRPPSYPDPIRRELRELATGAGVHLVAGNRALRRNEPEAAAEHYRRAVEANAESAEAHLSLAATLARLGQPEEAAEHYERSLAIDPENPAVHYNLGTLLAAQGRPEASLPHFRTALELAPSYANARFNLATALLDIGKPEEALAHLQRLADSEEESASTRLATARALEQSGRPEEALPLLQAVATDPDVDSEQHLVADRHRARLLAQLGRFDQAAGLYRKLVERFPDEPETRFASLMTLLLAEHYPDAAAALEEATERFPNNLQITHLQARFLATCPEPDLRNGARALQLAQRLFGFRPQPAFAETVAMAHAELGQFDQAIRWQQRLLTQARRAGMTAMLPELERRMAGYEEGRPVRAPWKAR